MEHRRFFVCLDQKRYSVNHEQRRYSVNHEQRRYSVNHEQRRYSVNLEQRRYSVNLEPGLVALVVDERAVLSVARRVDRRAVPLQTRQPGVDGVDGEPYEGVNVQGPSLGLAYRLVLAGLLLDLHVVHGPLHNVQAIGQPAHELPDHGQVVVLAGAPGEDGAEQDGPNHVDGQQHQDDGPHGA